MLYDIGHIPNAVKVDWVEDLNDPPRGLPRPRALREPHEREGSPGDNRSLHGDKNNWWATYALWVFRLFRP